jgi:hypothetical protein
LETALKPRIIEVIMHLIIVVHVGVEVGDGVEAEDHGGHQVVGVEAVAPFQKNKLKMQTFL